MCTETIVDMCHREREQTWESAETPIHRCPSGNFFGLENSSGDRMASPCCRDGPECGLLWQSTLKIIEHLVCAKRAVQNSQSSLRLLSLERLAGKVGLWLVSGNLALGVFPTLLGTDKLGALCLSH